MKTSLRKHLWIVFVLFFVIVPMNGIAEENELNRDATEGFKGVTFYGNLDMASAGILKYDVKIADLEIPSDSSVAQTLIRDYGFSSVLTVNNDTFYVMA